MADRIYDRVLKCGCSLSSDAGGCVMSCYAEYGDMSDPEDKKQLERHKRAWELFWDSEDAKEYEKECEEKNS